RKCRSSALMESAGLRVSRNKGHKVRTGHHDASVNSPDATEANAIGAQPLRKRNAIVQATPNSANNVEAKRTRTNSGNRIAPVDLISSAISRGCCSIKCGYNSFARRFCVFRTEDPAVG